MLADFEDDGKGEGVFVGAPSDDGVAFDIGLDVDAGDAALRAFAHSFWLVPDDKADARNDQGQ